MKTRLVIAAALCVLLLTSLADVGIYLLVRRHNIETFDRALEAQARLIASWIEVEEDELDIDYQAFNREEFASPDAGGFLQIWSEGRLIHQSASFADASLRWLDALPTKPDWIALPTGRRGRAVQYSFHPLIAEDEPNGGAPTKKQATICLARDFTTVDESLATLRATLIGSGLLMALLIPLTILFIVRRTLRPVDALSSQLASMNVESINQAIKIVDLPRELQPIVEQFNALMSRVHAAFEREKNLSADIAHELRTPIAGLRAMIEVALSRPRDPVDYQATLAKLLQNVLQMQTMSQSLMMLAELESGRQQARSSTVNLEELVQTILTESRGSQPAKSFELDLQLNPASIETDPELAGTAIRNLLDNAFTYVNSGGQIEVATGQSDSKKFVRVTNTGSRIASDEVNRVFDRFWRGDLSRAQTGRHFGLGLPLTRRIVDRLHADIYVESTPGGKFHIAINWNSPPRSA